MTGALVLAFFGILRIGIGAPWGYDDYYHLGVARELWQQFPMTAFPWTPFSALAEHYADKEPLFHILLMPFANLSLSTAALLGALLGQAFLIGSVVWFLVAQRISGAAGWLLCLAGLGPLFVLRIEMVRPHVWMLGFSVLVLGLLLKGARPWVVAVVCALFGLVHTTGWIAVGYALVWSLCGHVVPPNGEDRDRYRPVLAAAAGWLLGQLLHPNLPNNFWLVWTQNVIVPLASVGLQTRSLRQALGVELQPASWSLLWEQWPLFVAPVIGFTQLLGRRQARTRAALTLAVLTMGFLLGGAFLLRRLLEIGAVLGLLLLAVTFTDRVRRGEPTLPKRWRIGAALTLALAIAWTVAGVRDFGRGDLRPLGRSQPLAMARFLGENGRPGDLVFTAQWADSAPLFYAAPQLRSLVMLDPTFLYAKEPLLFDRYWAIAHGQSGDPVGEIARRFGARYVTILRAPGFEPLARQLRRDPRARIVYEDRFYEVWTLTT